MAEEQKQSWWKSLPGLLTAASGFVAALSGLVAGLNQLGVFRRDQPAQQVVGVAPAARDSTAQHSAAPVTGGSASSAGPAPAPPLTPSAGAPSKAPTASSPRPASPPASEPAAPRPANSADTAVAGSQRLPKGTALELAVPSRICAPPDGQRRFTARLAAPLKLDGATVLRANTTAVLHIRRAGSAAAPQVRLDSLVEADAVIAVPPSQVRFRRDAVSGTCLRADARITVTLGAATTVGRR